MAAGGGSSSGVGGGALFFLCGTAASPSVGHPSFTAGVSFTAAAVGGAPVFACAQQGITSATLCEDSSAERTDEPTDWGLPNSADQGLRRKLCISRGVSRRGQHTKCLT